MSKKFYAVNRESGEKWKPKNNKQFLMMWDSGYLAVVTDLGMNGHHISPLDTKAWHIVNKFKESK